MKYDTNTGGTANMGNVSIGSSSVWSSGITWSSGGTPIIDGIDIAGGDDYSGVRRSFREFEAEREARLARLDRYSIGWDPALVGEDPPPEPRIDVPSEPEPIVRERRVRLK